jgi:hypothetical protein
MDEKLKKELLFASSISICLLICMMYMVSELNKRYTNDEKIINEIKEMVNVTSLDYTILYGRSISYREDSWVTVQIKSLYQSEPWKNRVGYIWYNLESKQYHIDFPN